MKLFATASNAASAHNFSLLKPVKPCYGNQNSYQPFYQHLSTHNMLITFMFIHKISPIFFLEFFYYPLHFFKLWMFCGQFYTFPQLFFLFSYEKLHFPTQAFLLLRLSIVMCIIFQLLFTGNIPRGVFCERSKQ